MKILRVLSIAVVCMVMALPVNSVGYQTTLFSFPAASISWGMQKSEIIERLGVDERKSSGVDGALMLTPEQLGWNPAEHLGLKLGQSRADWGSIRIRFTDEDNVYGPEGLDTLYAMTFCVLAPDAQTAVHRFTRLYGEPLELDTSGDSVWAHWACFPSECESDEPNPQNRWGLYAYSDSLKYPHFTLRCESYAKGGVICEVSFYTGTGNYPEGTRIVWCPGQP